MQKNKEITHEHVKEYLLKQKYEMQLREFLGLPDDVVFDADTQADEYEQGREDGERAFALLVSILAKEKRFNDIRRLTDDPDYKADLYKHYGITYEFESR